jgi:O-antigen/teichoic acid export membrane protein
VRRFLKGASVLTVSQGLVAASSFLRNVVVARLISVEDFGIATTFSLTISLLEMTSNLALDRVLIQDDRGDSDAMLASAHLLQFIRGLLMGTILFLAAGPVATLFELPQVTWAFRALAAVPVIRGLVHWDAVSRQRKLDFKATAVVDALPQVTSVLIAYLGAMWLKDYRVMLLVVVGQVALTVGASHVLARRPYRWLFRRDLASKKLHFGWPLLINGLLMFGIFQGDRVLVGALFDMATLGWYSVAFSLVLLPTLLFAKVCGYLLMPGLSGTKHDPAKNSEQCLVALVLCFGCGAFLVTFFAIGGKSLLVLAFGEKYNPGNGLLMVLAIAQALRIMRVAPTMIANSQAATKNAMFSNMFRTLALPLAFTVAWLGHDVFWVAAAGIVGEGMALFASFRMLRLPGFKPRFVQQSMVMGAGFVVLAACAFGVSMQLEHSPSKLLNVLLVLGGGILGLAAALALPSLDADTRGRARSLAATVQRRLAARGR